MTERELTLDEINAVLDDFLGFIEYDGCPTLRPEIEHYRKVRTDMINGVEPYSTPDLTTDEIEQLVAEANAGTLHLVTTADPDDHAEYGKDFLDAVLAAAHRDVARRALEPRPEELQPAAPEAKCCGRV